MIIGVCIGFILKKFGWYDEKFTYVEIVEGVEVEMGSVQ